MRVSLVLVAHGSSPALPAAIDSFRAEARGVGVEPEVVVVEQSEVDEELRRVQGLGADALLARPNRGYAAGLNAGVAAARGEVLLLGNPDVRFGPGALAALLAALGAGFEVVGPQFELAGFLYPPAEAQTPAAECGRWLASRSAAWWRRHFQGELASWLRAWRAASPIAVATLSGALLAVTAQTAAAVGPFDEGYFLYFEETDWLRRARRAGRRLAIAPAARVEHTWGHAAGPGGQAAAFGRSRRRFYARHFGLAGRAAARLRLDRSPLLPRPPAAAELEALPAEAWLLASPSPLGFPAAGLPPGASREPALADLARRSGYAGAWTVHAAVPGERWLHGPWRWPASPPR